MAIPQDPPAFDASCLIPGFTAHAFSQTRKAIYKIALASEDAAHRAGAVVLAELTKWIEVPFLIIEDVALTVINVVGAFFKEECKNNLKNYIGKVVAHDFVTILTLPASLLLVPVRIFSVMSDPDCLQELWKAERDVSSHLEAVRKHGYDAIVTTPSRKREGF